MNKVIEIDGEKYELVKVKPEFKKINATLDKIGENCLTLEIDDWDVIHIKRDSEGKIFLKQIGSLSSREFVVEGENKNIKVVL